MMMSLMRGVEMKTYLYGCSVNCECGTHDDPITVGGGSDVHTIDWVGNDLIKMEKVVGKYLNKREDSITIDRTHDLVGRLSSVSEGSITTVFVDLDGTVEAVIFCYDGCLPTEVK